MATSSRSVIAVCHSVRNVNFKPLPILIRQCSVISNNHRSLYRRCLPTNATCATNNLKAATEFSYRQFISVQRFSSSPPPTSSVPSKWAVVRLIQKSSDLTERVLYRVSPKLHGLYRQFIDGGKAFITDVRFVYALRGRIKKENIQLQELPWKDIYIKDKVTRDMGKVIPTMIVTWLPFAFYVMLPLIFTFPRQFLSDHFLNKDQLSEFQRKSLERKHQQESQIWELLKKEMTDVKSPAQTDNSLGPIEKCEHLDVAEIMKYRAMFDDQLSLGSLPRNHLVALCKLHSLLTLMLPSFLLRRRLEGKCSVLQAIDYALMRDGIENLEEQDLKKLCYQRVFPTYKIPSLTLQSYLYSWVHTTAALRDSEKALYLHLPLFKKKTTTAEGG